MKTVRIKLLSDFVIMRAFQEVKRQINIVHWIFTEYKKVFYDLPLKCICPIFLITS